MQQAENESICLCNRLFTALSLKPVVCKKKEKKCKLTVDRLHGGGIKVVSVYLLIAAGLVLCGEGCLTATLLGSAV